MGLHLEVEGFFGRIIKSNGQIKYFRCQCATLIEIARHLWRSFEVIKVRQNELPQGYDSLQEYDWFRRFIVIAEEALEFIANHGRLEGLRRDYSESQQKLDRVTEEIENRWGRLERTAAGELSKFDPVGRMKEAKKRDEERNKTVISSEKLKEIAKPKDTVDFLVHDGGGMKIVSLKICRQSTLNEVLFRLGRNESVAIKLRHNASFYQSLNWKETSSDDTSDSYPRKGLSDFTQQFGASANQRRVHVLVDRNPCVQILLNSQDWSRLYSLVKLIEGGKCIVLKGVEGTLHHGRRVFNDLMRKNVQISNYEAYINGDKSELLAHSGDGVPDEDYIWNLIRAHNRIRNEEMKSTNADPRSWLIRMPLEPLRKALHGKLMESTPKFAPAHRGSPGPSTPGRQSARAQEEVPLDLNEAMALPKGAGGPFDEAAPIQKLPHAIGRFRFSPSTHPLPSLGQVAGRSIPVAATGLEVQAESSVGRNPQFNVPGLKPDLAPKIALVSVSQATNWPSSTEQTPTFLMGQTSSGPETIVAKDHVKALVQKYDAGDKDHHKKKGGGFLKRLFGGKK